VVSDTAVKNYRLVTAGFKPSWGTHGVVELQPKAVAASLDLCVRNAVSDAHAPLQLARNAHADARLRDVSGVNEAQVRDLAQKGS